MTHDILAPRLITGESAQAKAERLDSIRIAKFTTHTHTHTHTRTHAHTHTHARARTRAHTQARQPKGPAEILKAKESADAAAAAAAAAPASGSKPRRTSTQELNEEHANIDTFDLDFDLGDELADLDTPPVAAKPKAKSKRRGLDLSAYKESRGLI
jgi:hypothetical protein